MTDLVPITTDADPALAPRVGWAKVLAIYLDTLSSPATRRTYGRAIRTALEALNVDAVGAIAAGDLTTYRAQLVARLTVRDTRHRLTPASVALALAALRAFLKFCRITGATDLSKEVIGFCLASPSATVQKPYAVLSDTEQRRILEVARTRGNQRDHALLTVLLATGLRVAEVCAVRVGDLSADDDGDLWIRVQLGKGRKDRLVPLAGDVATVVLDYLASTGRTLHGKADQDIALFRSRQGDRILTTTRVFQLVQAYARAAGVTTKAITPHSLRHTYAIGQLRAGASPIVVQKLLGHSSVQTTQRYLDHLDRSDLKRWARSPGQPRQAG